MTRLDVHLGSRLVGSLSDGPTGNAWDYEFSYAEAIAAAAPGGPVLSMSLPVRREVFRSAETRPFFEGILPEAAVRQQLAPALHISPENSLGLLGALGRDCAGAVVILPKGSPPPEAAEGDVEWLSEGDLAALVRRLPQSPLGIAGDRGARLSLAGVQRKAVLVRTPAGDVGLPTAGAPSTHILKPQYADAAYEDIVFNERFCMRVAECVGLDVARTEIVTVGEHPCLLVERFDRSSDGRGVLRLHQEDFCQALGWIPGLKYETEGGPGFRPVRELLGRASSRAGADVLAFVRAAIVNFVLGNSDAHAKNFALLYAPTGVRLAPLYDIVSTSVYPGLDASMAMAIGENADPASVDGGDWMDFAEDLGLTPSEVRRLVAQIARRTVRCATQVARLAKTEGWHRPVIDRIVELTRVRAGGPA